MLELVDEADSKSVGLITRVGSNPTTGTITTGRNGSTAVSTCIHAGLRRFERRFFVLQFRGSLCPVFPRHVDSNSRPDGFARHSQECLAFFMPRLDRKDRRISVAVHNIPGSKNQAYFEILLDFDCSTKNIGNLLS